MSEPIPIRRNVTPQFDAEREMIDYCALKVREFSEEFGAPPTRIVMSLMGRTSDTEQSFTTNFWDAGDSRTPSELLGHAIALLTRRLAE